METKELLTNDEVAARLRASPSTLARWRVQGTGPKYIKRKGRVLYRSEAVDDFERENERSSTRGA